MKNYEYYKYWLEGTEQSCWVLKIKSLEELLSFFEVKISKDWVKTWFEMHEKSDKTGHYNSPLQVIIGTELSTKNELSLVEFNKMAIEKGLLPKIKLLVDNGSIYINLNGGFFGGNLSKYQRLSDTPTILDNQQFIGLLEKEIDVMLSVWPKGIHYYLYINGEWYKEIKFDNKQEAFKYIKDTFKTDEEKVIIKERFLRK